MPLPSMPVVFNKFPQRVIGPDSPVLLPRASKQVDYEAELVLVLVLGKGGKNISEKDALDHIAGHTIGNDVSVRDWQIGAAGGLNGVTMQDSSTKELIFGLDKLITHLSLLTTLEPGDIVYTGTPPGVLRNSVLDEEG